MKTANNLKEKVRGRYQNWFLPILWPPIFSVVKQHRNFQEALDFLTCAYRKSGDLSCVYDHFHRNILNGWFHLDSTLRDTIKRCIELGNYFAKSIQYCPILASYPIFKKEICDVLEKQRKADQPLNGSCIREPHLLHDSNKSGFQVGIN
jgi:hypothetical protein